ncbi:MAG TPA: CHASE2 domain-containing protein [Bryobacteraceae bacterium]|nr:CHASE2 domain-containing protein [Bryobacteraceae bacterium]
MERRSWNRTATYVGLLAAAFVAAVLASWGLFRAPLDNSAYDQMFRLYRPKPWQPQSAILAIDEGTLAQFGGMRRIRKPLADALRLMATAKPAAVAVDVIQTDPGEDPQDDRALSDAFCQTHNLVLSSLLMDNPVQWEDPKPEFARCAAAIGHVHAEPDDNDNTTRSISLEKIAGHDRRWALALESFRLSRGVPIVERQAGLESVGDVQVGDTVIPTKRTADGRLMRVRYIPPGMEIPKVPLRRLLEDNTLAVQFAGKVVFVGVTANTEVRDRLFTPYAYGQITPGIEINAAAFETIAQHLFITDIGDQWVLLFSLGLVVTAGLSFRYLPGWWAYAGCGLVLAAAVITPYVFFLHQRVLSLATPLAAATFATATAAAYYHLVARRNWRMEQSTRERYQQAMHFVTHEMRTPLSAIQGSSELISKYALTEEKRKQVADLINSESKRLARMVEVFLHVERLTAGQMELKPEPIPVGQMVDVCVTRVRPVAERKRITVTVSPIPDELHLSGDRELMEYACYNLLTNAVKYSPQRTEVTVSARKDQGRVRIAVSDQGIGMDQKEVKQIFQKFYRTKKAEESGEAGTGIGLSIVQQIVEQHGGEIEVTSQPGAGSCFTLVLPAAVHAAVPSPAERH